MWWVRVQVGANRCWFIILPPHQDERPDRLRWVVCGLIQESLLTLIFCFLWSNDANAKLLIWFMVLTIIFDRDISRGVIILMGDVLNICQRVKWFFIWSERCLKRSEVVTVTYDFELAEVVALIVTGVKFLCVLSRFNCSWPVELV